MKKWVLLDDTDFIFSGKGISNVESSPTIKSKGRNTNPKSNPQPSKYVPDLPYIML